MLQRTLPAGFIAPCLPTKAATLPSGRLWLREIKHDGFRVIARKDRDWLKFKNPAAPAVKREAEEDWGRRRSRARIGS
jgi:hypothetical protein